MKIAVGLIFFNDVESLKRCIPTLKVDTIYAVDGRFKNFDAKNSLSTDGSREYLKTFKNVKIIDAPDLKEVDKRNIYLDECNEEFLLRIDSDEWVEGDWSLFRKELEANVKEENGPGYCLWMNDLERNDQHWQYVGYHNPKRIRYKYRHDWFEADGKRILPYSHNKSYTKLTSLKIFNEKLLRSNERKKLGDQWYEKSRKIELRKTSKIYWIKRIKNFLRLGNENLIEHNSKLAEEKGKSDSDISNK